MVRTLILLVLVGMFIGFVTPCFSNDSAFLGKTILIQEYDDENPAPGPDDDRLDTDDQDDQDEEDEPQQDDDVEPENP